MDNAFMIIYIILSIFIAAVDITIAQKSMKRNKTTGRHLGMACILAAVVDLSYLISILSDNYMCMSVMSSIYFVSIDIMLLCFVAFAGFFTNGSFSRLGQTFMKLAGVYTIFEIIVFAINPFKEIAVSYIPRNTVIASYSYDMHPLYYMHLIFSYSMVIVSIVLIFIKIRRVPVEYRMQYNLMIIGVVTIVLINAVFLFLPGEHAYNLLDYSICGYSLTILVIYWSCFNYSTHGMLNRLKNSIFENIGQGIVLFDYEDELILHNERADSLLGGIDTESCSVLSDFLEHYNLPPGIKNLDDGLSIQCYISDGEKERPLRCDVKLLINSKNQKVGRMLVFSDAALETDLLTGFQNWDSFQMLAQDEKEHFTYPIGVAICDINGLAVINATLGANVGNQKIKHLAECMRQCFPKRTYFVRGVEANLIAICSHGSEAEMQDCLIQVKELYDGKIQYAVSVATQEEPDILDAITNAGKAMRAKKLVDKGSAHSDMLKSLIRALEECDSDTEHHVKRTQNLGAVLGKRIDLTDIQQSRLALLCLLHDIGKIGIPLEILNKPGKLTDEEWNIMRTHTEKGYEIARSNSELIEIAEEIRHHHERWDGKGYPDGLSRESIPILSRVIAVVDAFDAMTNDRSYRAAMPIPRALEELKRCAGTQFDPFIVSEFISIFKDKTFDIPQSAGDGIYSRDYVPEQMREQFEKHVHDDLANKSIYDVTYSKYHLDNNLRIVWADENFEGFTGYSHDDIKNNNLTQLDLVPEEDRMEYLCQINKKAATENFAFLEHRLLRKNGECIFILCCGRVYYDSAVKAERSEIIISDVSRTHTIRQMREDEMNKAQSRLKHWEGAYRKDSLTGLLNHGAFRSDMELRMLEGSKKAVMLMMDVDKFKEYNDTYGHLSGDNYLILVARTLQKAVGSEECVCRMGGDEFAGMVFFEHDESRDNVQTRMQAIFDEINGTVMAAEGGTSISMGAAIASNDMTFNEIYDDADKALYVAKDNGRGRLHLL